MKKREWILPASLKIGGGQRKLSAARFEFTLPGQTGIVKDRLVDGVTDRAGTGLNDQRAPPLEPEVGSRRQLAAEFPSILCREGPGLVRIVDLVLRLLGKIA